MTKESRWSTPSLTRREREILRLFAEGYGDKEIADELDISERAVKANQLRLMRRLHTHDMSSAIEYALKSGLITVFEILESRFSKLNRASEDYIQ